MKKKSGLIVLATLLFCSSFVSIEARNKAKDKQIIQLNNSFCKSIGKKPVITVCVSGNPGEGEFNENTLKSLKSSAKSLVHKYKKSQKFINAKFSTTTCGSPCTQAEWDPATCDPLGQNRSFCEVYSTDPLCMPPTCSSPYDWGPSCDPLGQNRSFCQVYPSDPMYCATQSSTCTYYDWVPADCGGAATYCHEYPNTSPHCVGLP